MLITIHQPDHFPWLGLINKVSMADVFVVLDCVQLSKRAFQHRNRVVGPTNSTEPTWLTVPIATANHEQFLLSDIKINNQIDWQRRYKNIFYERYHQHPFWPEHSQYLESIWQRSFDKLTELNMDVMHYLLDSFGIKTPIVFASALKPLGSKSELNLDICKKMKASTYLAGPLSKLYLNEDIFSQHEISVKYHEFSHPTYKQYERQIFLSHLSAFDLLMNYGNEGVRYIGGGKS